MKKFEKVAKIVVDIFLVITAIAVVFALYGFYQLKIQKKEYFNIFGYTAFNVVTGSMEPTLYIGDIIVVKIDKNIKEDDIITYYKDGDFITHRVVKIEDETIITRGDSNNSSDSPITGDMIIGRVVKVFSGLGSVIDIILTPKIFILIMIALFFFSLFFSYIPTSERVKYDKDGIEILEVKRRKHK